MRKQGVYTVGGTVQAGDGIYLKRKADDELLELCRKGELAFILSSRQVGKSSLMTQTAGLLEEESIRSATVDLSSIGTKLTQEEWYLGILNVITTDLNLETDLFAWWTQYSGLGPAQRFFNFLRDVVLREVKACIVLFFDEIDTTRSIPFADDFFATVRATYNARSTTPDFKRLSFVLVGVATPSDLISDENRTPFNIGRRVELSDFTLEEAMPLAQGLGDNAKQVLGWILQWSSGHPYLTQRLCEHLSKRSSALDRQTVALAAEDLFLGEQGKQDNNLQFVRDMLVKRSPDSRRVMLTYADIRSGKKVVDDERSIIKAHLKISGIVRRRADQLIPRNRIYEHAFNPKWIKENMPSAVPRRIMVGSTIAVMFALFIAAFFAYREWTLPDAERATRLETTFNAASSYQQRLDSIAGLFNLADKQYTDLGLELFNSLEHQEQLELFTLAKIPRVKEKQFRVALGVYQSLGFRTETDVQGDELLAKISDALSDNEQPQQLREEIDAWLAGRAALANKNYPRAKEDLSGAIRINNDNPALYFDRARAYIGMGYDFYVYALEDLTQMVILAPNQNVSVRTLFDSNDPFREFWISVTGNFPVLNESINLPLSTISGGADKIAFVANNDIWLMNTDGSELTQLTNDSALKSDLQWLPDGETIIFISGLTIKYVNITTRVVDILTNFPAAASLNAFRVSHDGRQVMISLNNEIFVVPFDFEQMRDVHKKSDLLALQGCISPEPKTKSALAVREAIWSANDELVAWLFKGVDPARNPSLIFDQVIVLDIKKCIPAEIDQLDNFPGQRFKPVNDEPVEYNDDGTIPDIDWDGNKLFVFNTNVRNNGWGELYVYDWSTHKASHIRPIDGVCCYRDARWSPGGLYLFFAFQDQRRANAPTLLYYVRFEDIIRGTSFTPLALVEGFFQDRREAPQPALRPTQ